MEPSQQRRLQDASGDALAFKILPFWPKSVDSLADSGGDSNQTGLGLTSSNALPSKMLKVLRKFVAFSQERMPAKC